MDNLKAKKTNYPLRIAHLEGGNYRIFNCKNFITIQLNSDSYKVFNQILENESIDINNLYEVCLKDNLDISREDIHDFIEFASNTGFVECV